MTTIVTISERVVCLLVGFAGLFAAVSLQAEYRVYDAGRFSSDFRRDYEAAQQSVNQSKSAEPLLALLAKYTNAAETAELELSIGLVYGQRTGLVDPAKAVVHFTAALRHELPERAYIEVVMWRGNSQEQLKKTTEALRDYLRGLLANPCQGRDACEVAWNFG